MCDKARKAKYRSSFLLELYVLYGVHLRLLVQWLLVALLWFGCAVVYAATLAVAPNMVGGTIQLTDERKTFCRSTTRYAFASDRKGLFVQGCWRVNEEGKIVIEYMDDETVVYERENFKLTTGKKEL